jgi:16S rRNA (cytosine967-C5)-methyltransferase
MRRIRSAQLREAKAARAKAIEALLESEQTSGRQLRTIIRDMQTASSDSVCYLGTSEALALSAIRYKNSIEYLIRRVVRSDVNGRDGLTASAMHLAVYEGFWLRVPVKQIHQYYSQWLKPWKKELESVLNSSLEDMTKKMPLVNRLSLTLSHPTFLVQTLLDNLPKNDAIALMRSLNSPRRYYLRPNRLHNRYGRKGLVITLQQAALSRFIDSPVVLEQDSEVPHIWEIKEGIQQLIASTEFRLGDVLVQDKASVIAVDSLDPRPGERIWDACAAPGMKTQLIAERVGASGAIVASDVYESRIDGGRHMMGRLGPVPVEWIRGDATYPAVKGVDRILIDAPCTSTGVLQTYPSFKWRLNKETLFALMTVQNKILDGILNAFSDAPGTEIVYSTCSILPHEGESQIDSALSRHNIELITPTELGSTGYVGFRCSSKVRRFFPHLHGCNGFFIARLRVKQ